MAIGKVVVDLFTTIREVNSNGQVINTRTQVNYEKNLRFDRNTIQELDSCNFQFYSNQQSNISPLDIVEIFVYNQLPNGVRELMDTYSYVVIQVDITNKDNKKQEWLNTITATECTKRLEGYFLTRDFSQPQPNELDTPDSELPSNTITTIFNGYPNRLKMLEEAKQLCYFRKDADLQVINIRPWDYIQGDPSLDPDYSNGEDNTGTTYALLSENLGTESIARVVASNDTLRDVIDEIFSSYNASARLDYINGRFRIMADNQNEVLGEASISRHEHTTIQRSINGYGTFANPELQNVVGQDSLATNGISGRPFVSEDVFTQTSTAKIVLDYPIKDIVKVEVARLDSNTWVDITENIIKADQRRFLNRKGTEIVSGDDLWLENVGSYVEGSNEINSFGDEFEGEVIAFAGSSITTAWQAIIATYGTTALSTDIRKCRARVQYRTMTTEKVHIFKNDFSDQKYLYGSPINVNAQTLDFKKAGIDLQDKIEKTGDETEQIDIVLTYETISKGANYYGIKQLDLNSQKVIVKVDNTLLNGNLKTKYTLAKGGYLNAQVNVDSLKRSSEIEDGLTREIIVNDFVNIYPFFGPVDDVIHSSLTDEGITKFMDTFRTSNSNDASVDNAIFVSNDLINQVSVSVSKHLTKDYSKVGFKAQSPVHLGYRQDQDNKRVAVRYALWNGTANNVGISFGERERTTNDETFNRTLPSILPSNVNPIEGTSLINMGDTSGITQEDGDSTTKTDSKSGSREDNPFVFTETAPTGSVLIPRFINFVARQNSDGIFGSATVGVDIEVYVNGQFAFNYDDEVSGRGDQTLANRVDITLGRVSSFEIRCVGSGQGQFLGSYDWDIEWIEQEVIENDSSGAEISVIKNPNEILGLSHALNVIKDTRIITGQALMIRNSLYTNFNYDSFVVYGSEGEYYIEGDETPRGTSTSTTMYFTVNDSGTLNIQWYPIDNTGLRRNFTSMAIFGITNGKLELLIAINAPYGEYLQTDQNPDGIIWSKIIRLNFSSKARGLIME